MEINPFHNGHIYFLSQIPKQENDILVAVISTTIVQRGEISILDKRVKTKLLLDHNVDIVIELPSIQANQGGMYFASNAINILKEFNITDLYFGSESNDLESLIDMSRQNNTNNFKNGIHKENLKNLMSNDILGISYIKALKNSNVNLNLVKRIENFYNDSCFGDNNIQSATSIRKHFDENKDVNNFLPEEAILNFKNINHPLLYQIFLTNLYNALDNNINIFLSENNQLLYKLDKILKENKFESIGALSEFAKDKNNSKYKIQRVIMNIIFFVEHRDEINTLKYIHVLGLTNNGAKYLRNLNNDKVVTSLKNQNCYVAKCELRISKLVENICDFPLNLDYQAPIIK